MQHCDSITLHKNINGTDMLKVTIIEDNDFPTEAYWFFDHNQALKYLDRDVIVDYRQEIIDGKPENVINTFTIPMQVNTITKADGIKLFVDSEDNYASISFNDLSEDEEIPNACLFCIKQTLKSSERSTWINYTVRDKFMRVATLRLFGFDKKMGDCSGKYIMVSPLLKTKYGFQTSQVAEATGEVPPNPEITIATEYIKQFFKNNAHITSILTRRHLLDTLANVIDIELGYGLVRLATELALTEQFTNITNSIDITSIQEALVAFRLYLLQSQSVIAESTRNVLIALKLDFTDKAKLVSILDVETPNSPVERNITYQIMSLADSIILAKKGISE